MIITFTWYRRSYNLSTLHFILFILTGEKDSLICRYMMGQCRSGKHSKNQNRISRFIVKFRAEPSLLFQEGFLIQFLFPFPHLSNPQWVCDQNAKHPMFPEGAWTLKEMEEQPQRRFVKMVLTFHFRSLAR